MTGNNVSHANNKTRRRFLPNIQETSVYSEALGRQIRVKVSTKGLKTIEHNGVKIVGDENLISAVAHHASLMFANNVVRYLKHLTKNGELPLDANDEITRETLVARGGPSGCLPVSRRRPVTVRARTTTRGTKASR